MAVIVEDIDQRATYFERRSQSACVVPIREDMPAAREALIQSTREACRKPLHRARERAPAFHLDQQMQVVCLNRELHDPHTEAVPRRGQSGDHKPRQPLVSDIRQPVAKPHRDVNRMPCAHIRPPEV